MEEENKSTGANKTNGSQLVLKNIQDLNGLRFVIPAYQRGFRWRWQQIRELIDDLYEFCDSDNPEKIYCLQNITVIKKKDETGEYYEVVDGQQRLTAIWMLTSAYRCTPDYKPDKQSNLPLYTICYHEKENLNNYCSKINEHLESIRKYDVNAYDKILTISPEDIDSKFIESGLRKLKDYTYSKGNDSSYYDDILKEIFNCRAIREGSKQICIFWNEISNAQGGSATPQNDDWAIERFSNLNAGKIPLTESELIKAYLINSLSQNKVPEFSLQWEEIERGMSDDEFWGFLSSKDEEYETRIDFLFDTIYSDSTNDESHALSLAVANDLTKNDAHNVWQNVVQCYQTLRDWYEDYYLYHMIGYIVAVEKKSSATVIKGLYKDYIKSSKADFKKELKKKILKLEELNPIIPETNGEQQAQGDFVCIDAAGDKLSYNKGAAKRSIKAVLLLFNIALLLNAHEINPDNATERFSFKLYKSKNNPIEIEHINPQHLEGKTATEAEKKKWAKGVLKIIGNDSLKDTVEKTDWKKQNMTLIEQLEEAADLHDISNLTLLDKKLNTSYKDNWFKQKRAHILAARFGYPVPKNAQVTVKEESKDDYYKQSVIFPGTMWVFLREYSDSSDEQSSGNDMFWTKKDREQYIRTMEESISRLLGDNANDSPKAEKQNIEENAE